MQRQKYHCCDCRVINSDLVQASLSALQVCLADPGCALLLDVRNSNESASSSVLEGTAAAPLLTAGWPAHSSPAIGQSELAAAAAASLDLHLDCPLAHLGSSAGLLLECPDALPAAAAGGAGHEPHLPSRGLFRGVCAG